MIEGKKIYKIRLEVFGPIHIGSGKVITSDLYIYEEASGMVHVLDEGKLARFMNQNGLLNEYQQCLFDRTIITEPMNMSSFLKQKGIGLPKLKECIRYSMSGQDINVDSAEEINQLEIKGFIKDTYGNPYIPGSSLRGAIRWALLNRGILNGQGLNEPARRLKEKWNKDFDTADFEMELDEIRKISKEIGYEKNQCSMEKWYQTVEHYMQAIQISDSKPLSEKDLILCQKVDMIYGTKTKKNELPVFFEALAPQTVVEFKLSLNDTILKKYTEELENVSVQDIFKALSISYQNVQKVFVSKYVDLNFLNRKSNQNATYLYLGGGTGYVSKSIIYSLLGYLDGVKIASRILHWEDRIYNSGNHKHDLEDLVISPHALKCTKYHKKLYEIGLCKVSVE